MDRCNGSHVVKSYCSGGGSEKGRPTGAPAPTLPLPPIGGGGYHIIKP